MEALFTFPSSQTRALQVNFCKNPRCQNFGVPASGSKFARRLKAGALPGKDYRLAAGGAGLPLLKCLLCGEHLPLKSNLGIAEELSRLTAHFQAVRHCCPTEGCSNSDIATPDSSAYYRFGKTEGGSSRFQCKVCKKTFSVSNRSTLRQREARKNVPLLQSLVNKVPLARAAEIHGISFQTIYDKLDFFHRQVLSFTSRQEIRLRELVNGTKRYISVDRQDYAVNWTHRKDKRNVVLRAIGSADLDSGFVFGMHLNFDGNQDAESVESDALSIGDYGQALPHRRYARLWLKEDYDKAVAASAAKAAKRAGSAGLLGDDIQQRYDETGLREDVENSERVSTEQRFPAKGMQVRSEYTMYAHFYELHDILRGAQKLRFFMDQESGIRAACLAAFQDEVTERRADAFFVRLGKELTVDEKRKIVRASRELFAEKRGANPGLTDFEVQVLMMKEQVAASAEFGKWSDRWALHPFPNQAEPQKAVCYLTDFGDYDEDHKARLFLKATLHPIDRFFMSIRRRLNMLKRPIGTASKAGRTWYGYSAYQPANIEKLLTVFRAYYNYCLPGADGNTPAMRLGLMSRPVEPAELLGM